MGTVWGMKFGEGGLRPPPTDALWVDSARLVVESPSAQMWRYPRQKAGLQHQRAKQKAGVQHHRDKPLHPPERFFTNFKLSRLPPSAPPPKHIPNTPKHSPKHPETIPNSQNTPKHVSVGGQVVCYLSFQGVFWEPSPVSRAKWIELYGRGVVQGRVRGTIWGMV